MNRRHFLIFFVLSGFVALTACAKNWEFKNSTSGLINVTAEGYTFVLMPGDTIIRSFPAAYTDPVAAVKTVKGYGDYVVPFTITTTLKEQTLGQTEFKPNGGRLRIINKSSNDISRITAMGLYGTVYLGDDVVFDEAVSVFTNSSGNRQVKSSQTNGLTVGSNTIKTVSAGTNYIYFYYTKDEQYKGNKFRIVLPLIVPLSGSTNFEFTDSTAVTSNL